MLSLRQGENKCFSVGVTVPFSLSVTNDLISCGVAHYLHMCGWALQAGAAGALCPMEPQLTVLSSIF